MARADKSGGLSAEDAALWRHVTRGVDKRAQPARPAKPTPRARAAKPAATAKAKASSGPVAAVSTADKPGAEGTLVKPARPARPPVTVEIVKTRSTAPRGRLPGLDKRSALKLQRGQMTIEGRLDLHGMTQSEAYRTLDIFLTRAVKDAKRCVLVITGKGTARQDGADAIVPDRSVGILRAVVPGWLGDATNRERVLAHQPAQLKDGGSGALYVLLKRQRRRTGKA